MITVYIEIFAIIDSLQISTGIIENYKCPLLNTILYNRNWVKIKRGKNLHVHRVITSRLLFSLCCSLSRNLFQFVVLGISFLLKDSCLGQLLHILPLVKWPVTSEINIFIIDKLDIIIELNQISNFLIFIKIHTPKTHTHHWKQSSSL